MKKYWKELVLAIFTVTIIIPLTIAFMLSFRFINTDTTNEWIGFWGGYLGSIIGALVAIYVMRKTIENEKSLREEDERERFFVELCELIAEYCVKINESNCHLLRFHAHSQDAKNKDEGEKWNYEAVYSMGEATKIEYILQIKLLSYKANSYKLRDELLDSIIESWKHTEHLHQVKVDNYEELEKEADELSDNLADLMELTYIFISENRG